MIHEQPADDILELAFLHVLGMLDPGEESAFQGHLQAGCEACQAEVDRCGELSAVLAMGVANHRPAPTLREKLLAITQPGPPEEETSPQVWKNWTPPDTPALHVVRDYQGDWETVMAGIHAKRLYVDTVRDTITMLVRMDPGAAYVPHRHAGPEQCFVLEGDLHDGEREFLAGDFQCAATGSIHGYQRTKQGCLLLIVCSQHDELLTSN